MSTTVSVMGSSMSNRCFLFAHRDGGWKLLALERSNTNKHLQGKWEPPGGSVDESEALLPATGMVRELDEETGFDPEMRFLSVLFFNKNSELVEFLATTTTHMTYYWRGRITGQRIRLSDEHSNFKWCSLEQFEGLDLTPRTRAAFAHFKEQLSAYVAELDGDNNG